MLGPRRTHWQQWLWALERARLGELAMGSGERMSGASNLGRREGHTSSPLGMAAARCKKGASPSFASAAQRRTLCRPLPHLCRPSAAPSSAPAAPSAAPSPASAAPSALLSFASAVPAVRRTVLCFRSAVRCAIVGLCCAGRSPRCPLLLQHRPLHRPLRLQCRLSAAASSVSATAAPSIVPFLHLHRWALELPGPPPLQ